VYLLFVEMYSNSLADYDLWGYLAFGRAFWETGHFPYRDLFSYTPTKTLWVYHEWLTGVLFYFIYRYAGDAGLQLLRYVLVLATLYLVYLTSVRRGGTPLFACIALVPAMLLMCFGYVPVRAQVLTYFFFILSLFILEGFRLSQRWSILLWLPPILVLWSNFHGGFVAGIGLISLYAIGEGFAGRKYIPIVAAGILAAATTIINPYGIQYWTFILSAVTLPRPDINEWISVLGALKNNIYVFPAYLFIVMSILCIVVCAVRQRKDYADFMVIVAVIFMGVSHIRHTVFLGLVFGAYLPVFLSEKWNSWREKMVWLHGRTWIPGAVFVCLVLLTHLQISFSRIPSIVPSFKLVTPQSKYPLGALNWIMQTGLQGNILPFFEWGEFIIWHFSPGCRVAMDGRYETVYSEHVYREYSDFLYARPAWRVFLQKYPHEMILLHAGIEITELMKGEKGWQIAYGDKDSVLFVRNRKEPQ
jgi:hypothetical protein